MASDMVVHRILPSGVRGGLGRLAPVLGLVLFVYIVGQIDLAECLSILRNCDWRYFAPCVLLAPMTVLLMSTRWRLILRCMGVDYPFTTACRSLIKGTMLGEVTPGRVGELFRVQFLVSTAHVSLGSALFSVVMDRIYDVASLALFLILSSIVLMGAYSVSVPLWMLALVPVGVVVTVAVVVNESLVRSILLRFLRLVVPKDRHQKVEFQCDEFYTGMRSLRPCVHAYCMGISAFTWFLKLFVVFLFARGLGAELSLPYVLSCAAIGVAVALLPVSISGMGTRDAVFIALMGSRGVSAELAVAISFLYLVFGILSVAIPGGAVYLSEVILGHWAVRGEGQGRGG